MYRPLDERFTFSGEGDAAMVKSEGAGFTVRDTVV